MFKFKRTSINNSSLVFQTDFEEAFETVSEVRESYLEAVR